MKKEILLLASLTILAAPGHGADEFVADELLVAFQPGTRGVQADGIRNGLGATRLKAWSEIKVEHWRLPAGLSVAQAIQSLSANPNLLYVEPNYIVHATGFPNDPRLRDQSNLHNIAQSGGAMDADIDALEAWKVRTDASSIVVAVVDSGIDYNHPDLTANIWINAGETGLDAQGRNKATNGIDDDGNGFVDDWHGWNFVDNTNDPLDDYSHGTHVAGIIGAVGNNGIGVAGVAWAVKLMPLKFLNANGSGAISGATDAILYAAKFLGPSGKNLVQISSHSWITGTKSKTLESAIKTCNALVVAAAGNNATNTVLYPAGYSLPNIVSVAATDDDDAFASFSNFGSWVHLAAPGNNILSTVPNNAYALKSGTSMATPHVSGIAALVLAQNPAFSIADLKGQILNNVDVLTTLSGKVITGGRLNARKALGAPELSPDTTAPAGIADLAATPISPFSVTLSWTAPGDDGNTGTAYIYDVRYSTSPINTEPDFEAAARASGEPSPQAAGGSETFTVEALLDNRTYYFAMKAVDVLGNVSVLSNPTSAATPKSDWFYLTLDSGVNSGNYASVGVRSNGYWAVAYDDSANGNLKCAYLLPSGQAYTKEIVMSGGANPSLAYSSSEEISISHRQGSKLYFVIKNGSTWNNTQIEGRDVGAGDTSLLYDSLGRPCISYWKTGRSPGLWFASRNGSSWTTQRVDPQAKAVYNQIALDPLGNPAIACSHDGNGDGLVDTLKFAIWNGTAWDVSVIDTGGWYVTVAYDPTTGYPAMAHWNAITGQLRFVRWNGLGWTAEIVDTAPSITGCSLAFGPDGKAYLAYGSDLMRLAIRDANSGIWTGVIVDESTAGSLRNSLKGRPLGVPTGVAYQGPAFGASPTTVRLALRQTPY